MKRCEICGHSEAAHIDAVRCALCGCTPQKRGFVQESFAFRGAVASQRRPVSAMRVSAGSRRKK